VAVPAIAHEFESNLPGAEIAWGKPGGDPSFKQAQQAAWSAAFRSQLQERSYEIVEIEGTLPDRLLGTTLFRNGPSRFERGRQRVRHYLDGDGYVYRIAIASSGRVYFDSKFVRTAEYLREQAADTFLFRSTFGTQKPGGIWGNACELYLKNPANTHIVPWGGKLLALYEAGLPYGIDPHTLTTIGQAGLDGTLVNCPLPHSRWETLGQLSRGWQAVTAHPHIDPVRDRLVTWSWGMRPSLGRPSALTIEMREYDRSWSERAHLTYAMPGAAVNPHDFALTQTYYVFFENRLAFNPWPYLLGLRSPADCLRMLSDRPTRVHLVPRPDGTRAGQEPLVLDTGQWFAIHQACACDRPDGSVEIYSSGWPASELDRGFLTRWGGDAPDFDAIPPTFLWHTTVHPHQRAVEHRVAAGVEQYCIDHPHPNPNVETQAVRYLYMTYSNTIGESSPPVGYLKLDLQTEATQVWRGDPLSFTEEPIFVPTPGARREDEGLLLGIVYDHQRGRSALVVLDAQTMASGPLCRLWFEHPVVHGLHGSWCQDYYGP
jgi:all-trans-8'-apo-beta-carotenal 15,15'-oxygenase